MSINQLHKMSNILISCIIPASAKDAESQNLKDLIASINAQDFPQDQIEIIVIGPEVNDPEQAKAEGIRRSKGEICAMFCADNYIVGNNLFSNIKNIFDSTTVDGVYTKYYYPNPIDNHLNRYFSLIGNNDPIAFYLGKADRFPHYKRDPDILFETVRFKDKVPSLGDNGFFYRSKLIKQSNIESYYPMDCAYDLLGKGHSQYMRLIFPHIWHRTSDNLISFLIKRYKYARDLYSDRTDRRWKIIDTARDKWMLAWFVFSVLTVIPCLLISIRGFLKIRDWAWFWHWPVCFGFLITYTILTVRNCVKVLSSYPLLEGLSRLGTVLSPCGPKPTKTLK